MFTSIKIQNEKEFEEGLAVLRALRKEMFADNADHINASRCARTTNTLMKALILYAEEVEMDDYTFIGVINDIFG